MDAERVLVPSDPITDALEALNEGDPGAMDRLIPLVYEQLRRMAHRQLSAETSGHTLSTTGLVHEAYLRLASQSRVRWADRAHFFSVAAIAMRRVLVDYARRHLAARRGGASSEHLSLRGSLDGHDPPLPQRAAMLVDLDEALERLAKEDPRLARVVECRFFAGLTESETAEALSISQRTVAREWVMAKAWLHRELQDVSW